MFVYASEPSIKCNPGAKHSPELRPKVTVTFTIARRRDCEGFGICNWKATFSDLRTNIATGMMYADDSGKNTFVIEIDKVKGLKGDSYSKYFQSGYFVMEDDAPIPSDILSALGISGSRILLQGRHPVQEKNGQLIVVIPSK